MKYQSVRKKQIVIVEHKATKGENKGKVIRVFPAIVKGKVKGSRTLILVEDLNVGLGFNPEKKKYEGYLVKNGWCIGKPTTTKDNGRIINQDIKVHVKELTLFKNIIKKTKKIHKCIEGTSPNRVYRYREIPSQLSTNHHIQHVSLNTTDDSINGCLFRLISNNRKPKVGPWIYFSNFVSLQEVKRTMQEYCETFGD